MPVFSASLLTGKCCCESETLVFDDVRGLVVMLLMTVIEPGTQSIVLEHVCDVFNECVFSVSQEDGFSGQAGK